MTKPPETLAEILVAYHHPDMWRRLQADHVPDHTGHCEACRSTTLGSPVWPCNLRALADEAARIAAALTDHGRRARCAALGQCPIS